MFFFCSYTVKKKKVKYFSYLVFFCFLRSRGKKHSVVLRTQLTVRVHACIGECRLTAVVVANRFTLEPPGREHIVLHCVCGRAVHAITHAYNSGFVVHHTSTAITARLQPCSFFPSPRRLMSLSTTRRSWLSLFGAAAGGWNTESWGQQRESASLMNGKKTGTNSSRCSSRLYPEAASDTETFFSLF